MFSLGFCHPNSGHSRTAGNSWCCDNSGVDRWACRAVGLIRQGPNPHAVPAVGSRRTWARSFERALAVVFALLVANNIVVSLAGISRSFAISGGIGHAAILLAIAALAGSAALVLLGVRTPAVVYVTCGLVMCAQVVFAAAITDPSALPDTWWAWQLMVPVCVLVCAGVAAANGNSCADVGAGSVRGDTSVADLRPRAWVDGDGIRGCSPGGVRGICLPDLPGLAAHRRSGRLRHRRKEQLARCDRGGPCCGSPTPRRGTAPARRGDPRLASRLPRARSRRPGHHPRADPPGMRGTDRWLADDHRSARRATGSARHPPGTVGTVAGDHHRALLGRPSATRLRGDRFDRCGERRRCATWNVTPESAMR